MNIVEKEGGCGMRKYMFTARKVRIYAPNQYLLRVRLVIANLK